MGNFSELLEQLRSSASHEVTAPASWAQGRALFGGLVGGLLYEAMQAQVGPERLLRGFSLAFVGPVAADVPARVNGRVLREGRAVSQLQAELTQGDDVLAVALGSFGAQRESELRVAADPAPAVPAPEACQGWTYVPGVSPAFTRHFDWRWAIGGNLFSGSREREMGGWVRFAEPPTEIGIAHLLGLVDAWPPAVLPMLSQRAPASSLTWAIDFIHPLPAIGPQDWLLYRAEVDHARDGYAQIESRMWTAAGELVALSRQTVAVFG